MERVGSAATTIPSHQKTSSQGLPKSLLWCRQCRTAFPRIRHLPPGTVLGRGAESEPARRMRALIMRVGATELHHSSDVQLGQLSMVGFLVQAQPSVDARCGSGRRKAGRQQGIRKRSNSCAKTWVQDKACSWRKQSLVHCSNLRLSSQPFMHLQVVRGRRLFHEFQTAVTATSERVGQVSG